MNKPLILVPIEPLTERYSASWYRNFPRLFEHQGFDVTVIDGVLLLDNEIKVGTFLDINSTVAYKMSQLQHIAELFHQGLVKPGTVFFFYDIEFWGLESVRLMSQLNNVPVKLCGFLHAASYTVEDAFSVAAPYQRFTEVGWVAALDKVFVGSEYHKQVLQEKRLWLCPGLDTDEKRVIVTRNPLFLDDYAEEARGKKQKKILLTNRFDYEKRPNQTLTLFALLKHKFPDWEFVVTSSRPTLRSNKPGLEEFANKLQNQGVITIKAGLTKAQYHRELAEAAIVVSHSIEENYGYCIAESIIYGALPLLRKGLSHDEFLDGDTRLSFDLEKNPYDDCRKAEDLMRAFGTPAWPAVPVLDTLGAQRIVAEVVGLSVE